MTSNPFQRRLASASHLKCYVHPRLNAVGVCAVCGRGVCRSCAVLVKGKIYCKQDVDQALPEGEILEVRKRGVSLTIASVFAYMVGFAGMIAGFFLVIIGILGQSQQSLALMGPLQTVFRYFSGISNSPGQLLVDLGLLILILGSVDIGAGYYLWRRSKWAGIGSVVVSIIAAALVIIYLGVTSTAGLIASAYLVSALIKGSALAAGRKHLD
jgi:hypothetical protein